MLEFGKGIHICVDKIEGEQHRCAACPIDADGAAGFDTRTGLMSAEGSPLAVLRAVIAVLHFEMEFKYQSGKEVLSVEDVLGKLARTSDAAGAEQMAMALVRRNKEVNGAPIQQTLEIRLLDNPMLDEMHAGYRRTGGPQ